MEEESEEIIRKELEAVKVVGESLSSLWAGAKAPPSVASASDARFCLARRTAESSSASRAVGTTDSSKASASSAASNLRPNGDRPGALREAGEEDCSGAACLKHTGLTGVA
jgi:hypothetical protein